MQFNVFIASLQSELNDYTSRTKTRLERWANYAHRTICQKRGWTFLSVRRSDDMTYAAADFPINIRTDIKKDSVVVAAQQINFIYDITDGTFYRIEKAEEDTIRSQFPTPFTTSGPPQYWFYVSANEINVFPSADANRIFRFSLKKYIPDYASGSTDELLIPDEYIPVLHELVTYRAYRFKSDDRAAAAKEMYDMLYADMVRSDANKIGIMEEDLDQAFYKFPTTVDNS